MTAGWALIRLYGAGGELLYVGATGAPDDRVAELIGKAAWGGRVRCSTVEWHPDRASAYAARRRAWREERPACVRPCGGPRRDVRARSSARVEACRALAAQGLTVAGAAREMGLSRQAVHEIARRHGVAFRRARRARGALAEQAVAMRARGLQTAQIARALGTTRGSVSCALWRAQRRPGAPR